MRLFLDAVAWKGGRATLLVCLGLGGVLGCVTFHVKIGIVLGKPARSVTLMRGDKLT